jgi:hypothetical protein
MGVRTCLQDGYNCPTAHISSILSCMRWVSIGPMSLGTRSEYTAGYSGHGVHLDTKWEDDCTCLTRVSPLAQYGAPQCLYDLAAIQSLILWDLELVSIQNRRDIRVATPRSSDEMQEGSPCRILLLASQPEISLNSQGATTCYPHMHIPHRP